MKMTSEEFMKDMAVRVNTMFSEYDKVLVEKERVNFRKSIEEKFGEDITGVLVDWSHDKGWNIMNGTLYGDKARRWREGTYIRTSTLRHKSDTEFKEGMVVSTRNSKYVLGREYKSV